MRHVNAPSQSCTRLQSSPWQDSRGFAKMLTTYQLQRLWHGREEVCKTNNKILLLLYSSHDPGTPAALRVSQAHSDSLSIPVGTVSLCARAPPVRSQKLMWQVRYGVDFYICIMLLVSAAGSRVLCPQPMLSNT